MNAESKQFVDDLAEEQENPTARFPTGFQGLDFAMGGGLHERRLVVVGGTSGAGKTTVALNVMRNVARHARVGIVPMEMGARDTRIALVAMEYGRTRDMLIRDMLSGVDEYEREAYAALARFGERDIAIARIEPGQQVEVEHCFKWAKREGVRALMIDHAQEFAGWDVRSGDKYAPNTIMERLWEIVHGGTPDERKVNRWPRLAVLLVAQLNRSADPHKPPSKEQFADSPQIERKADSTWLVHRPKRGKDGSDNVIELVIDKNRTGRETTLPLVANFAAGLLSGMSVEETEQYFAAKGPRRAKEEVPASE